MLTNVKVNKGTYLIKTNHLYLNKSALMSNNY